MSDITRRGFVKSSVGAAAGVTVLGALGAAPAGAAPGSEPVVAYVADPNSGEVSLMSGEREVSRRDADLAARIARAAQS